MSAITPFNPSGVRLGDIQISTFDEAERFSRTLVSSGVLNAPELRNPAAVFALTMKGAELGVPPMAALNGIHVIKGKPTISPELMRALAIRAGHKVRVKADDVGAVVTIIRADDPVEQRFAFTMEDARRAGLLNSSSWQKYPRAMLVARATSEAMRAACPDVLMGASYTPEELGADVELGEDGEMVVVTETVRDEAPAHVLIPCGKAQRELVDAIGDTELAREVWQDLGYGQDDVTRDELDRALDEAATRQANTSDDAGDDTDEVDAEDAPDGPDFDAAAEPTDDEDGEA